VLRELGTVEEVPSPRPVEAEDAPGGFRLRKVFDPDAVEGSVAAQKLLRGRGAFGLDVDQDAPAALEEAQVGVDAALRVQEQGVGAEVVPFRAPGW
jgi:hypothetical protein